MGVGIERILLHHSSPLGKAGGKGGAYSQLPRLRLQELGIRQDQLTLGGSGTGGLTSDPCPQDAAARAD